MTFNLTTAAASTNDSVDLTFDGVLNPAIANIDPASYAFSDGLAATGISVLTTSSLRVYTTRQRAGVTYAVTVVGDVRAISTLEALTGRLATFEGVATPVPFVVADLKARTDCRGRRTYLAWSTPDDGTGSATVRVYRRTRSWPFDLTDPADLVYEKLTTSGASTFDDTGIVLPSTTTISVASVGDTSVTVDSAAGFVFGQLIRVEKLMAEGTYYDIVEVTGVAGAVVTFTPGLSHEYEIGSRVSLSSELLDQTFYYYLVVALNTLTGVYEITAESRTWALSIARLDSKNHFWKWSPAMDKLLDSLPESEGGGGGFQDKWFSVMGCWLNLMRGWSNAIQTLNDPDQAPFHTLTAKNLSLGIEPEGAAYDFNIARRALMSLVYVYHRKGTCPGVIEAVRMFTMWDAECVAFGHAEGGPSPFKLWNGTSGAERQVGYAPTLTCSNRLLRDTARVWDASLWKEGTVFCAIGDVAIVVDNDATELTLLPVQAVTYTTAAVTGSDTTIPVASTVGLSPHLTVQIEDSVDPAIAEIVEILSVSAGAPGSITVISRYTSNTYASGAAVSIGKSLLRSEYLGPTVGPSALGQVITDVTGRWAINAWTGYSVLDQANVVHNVVSNTETTITVDGAAPTSGQYAIAVDFLVGATFADRVPRLRYTVTNGDHYRLFEPTLDLETRGTFYDPFSYLWQGPGATILGAWGSGDLGVYILGAVPVTIGKAVSAVLNVLTLDPSSPPPTTNELVGMRLNPNQNQERLFRIVANDATTITVDQAIAALVVPGQVYYVLKPRDAARFKRINQRLKQEFTHPDITPHVLFM